MGHRHRLGLSKLRTLWNDLINWVQTSKKNVLFFLMICHLATQELDPSSAVVNSAVPWSYQGKASVLAKGLLAHEQVLTAVCELMAQKWALGFIWIERGWENGREKFHVCYFFFMSGLPFLLDCNPFQIPLLNHEYVVC